MILRFGQHELDDQRYTLTGPDGPVHLERQVFEVLRLLLTHRDRVVSKEELLDTIWGDRFVSESTLTSRIKAARRAIGDDGTAQRLIKTVHGRGYHFVAEVTELDDAPATNRSGTRPLPRLRTVPIGRDVDIDGLASRVRGARLVTVTGTGGVGKTTLALAVAERLSETFDEGAAFVDLTTVPAGGDVTGAAAAAAGIEGDASTSADRLAEHLGERPMLLVLDNCEHVLDSASRFVDHMLAHGTTIHLLATSREPLGIPGEHLWPLGPLGDAGPTLFVERAQAAEPRVDWNAEDPVIVGLCGRLDNLPLAIELAAGQLRRFDLSELARNLEDHLAAPVTRHHTDTTRHETMESTVDWSYRLLDADEQRLLRHLGVFPSTFDVSAVEETAPELSRPVTSVLGQLVDKCLVARELGAGRYRLLELIRMFARERLAEAGETDDAMERHRRWIVERVASAPRVERWMSATLAGWYRTARDDVRQAIRLSLDTGLAGDAVELAVGASFLWRNTVGCAEGDQITRDLLTRHLDDHDRLWVHILRADVGQGRGDHTMMFGAASDALELVPVVDDLAAASIASHYGALASMTDPEHAHRRLAAALELAIAADHAGLVALMEAFLVVADINVGDADAAHARIDHLARAASADGYDHYILNWAAWMLALVERQTSEARRWMDLQIDLLDRTGVTETWLSSFSTTMTDVLAGVDPTVPLGQVLALADREGYDASADCVLALVWAAICDGRFEEAAELLGTAVHDRFNATAHYVLYRVVLDRMLRDHLDRPAILAAMDRGARCSAAEALAAHGVSRGVPPR